MKNEVANLTSSDLPEETKSFAPEREKKETLACLIIDDPVLKPTYGCMNFSALLREMKEHSFFTEIAFIPWNYKRSDPETVRLLANNPEHFALCVHGCNHTSNEFGTFDYDELFALSSTALWRMEQHRKLTGLPYDQVIVFPRGRFSTIAMKVLRDLGFLAAFNTEVKALDYEKPVDENEFLKPAISMYYDFPLFLRHYPYDRSKFLQDIKYGRPIIIVEHHGAFRNGYKEITDLIDWINSLGNIRWTSLMNIAEHYLNKKSGIIKETDDLSNTLKNTNSVVAVQRFILEARDNLIETNSFLNAAYRKIRNAMYNPFSGTKY